VRVWEAGARPTEGAPRLSDRALLDHAERMGVSASWEWTPQTGELHWSANFLRLWETTA
jgi:hypothetical protein